MPSPQYERASAIIEGELVELLRAGWYSPRVFATARWAFRCFSMIVIEGDKLSPSITPRTWFMRQLVAAAVRTLQGDGIINSEQAVLLRRSFDGPLNMLGRAEEQLEDSPPTEVLN